MNERKLPKEVRAITTPNFTTEEQIVAFLAELAEGKTCPHCHAPVTELYQVGRCVYNRGCQCRQYQGVVPKEKRTPKDQAEIDYASIWSPLEPEDEEEAQQP